MHVQPTLDVLKTRGHNAISIDLLAIDTSKPRPTWEQEVLHITNSVLSQLTSGRDVVLVLHSYAGLPGCEALNRIVQAGALQPTAERKGRLLKAIFFYAHHAPTGLVMDVKAFVGPQNPAFSIDESTDLAYHDQPYELFFNDIPTKEEAKPYLDEIKPMWYIPGGGAIASDDWQQAPRSIVASSKDKALLPEILNQMWGGHQEEIVWTETAHTPFMTQPEEIADLWIDLASKPSGEA
ncbi:hypothetical protein M409DRAFT_59966 [Zasmidium cellare ATCC 36951]|uniref:AB hydrolase-1 domain-containing protein n=1 Tax=Zasmidium cellare ATCC 36951 TaxID=1080233 RepID=A0A6A6C0F3_ZASCE|nr:uncharacterized protein M409DRAFT_59966 [Zasmidium cellare ATCC 36951]KAF2160491.1 hypothetical protein M409DRAFT_59966 [Zasmidium cellare ATCC 36951]